MKTFPYFFAVRFFWVITGSSTRTLSIGAIALEGEGVLEQLFYLSALEYLMCKMQNSYVISDVSCILRHPCYTKLLTRGVRQH